MSATYPQLLVESQEQWHQWLLAHHDAAPGVWVVTWKKGRGPYVAYDDVVDEAIAFGWVDGQGRPVDDERSQRLVTPRRPRSGWSRKNKERVARLTAAGLMQPAGLRAVEASRRDGGWTALDQVEELHEPAELAAALAADTEARRHWDAFPRSTKRAILEWIGSAKTDVTRTRRIATTVSEAAQGRRANQWRQPKGTQGA